MGLFIGTVLVLTGIVVWLYGAPVPAVALSVLGAVAFIRHHLTKG